MSEKQGFNEKVRTLYYSFSGGSIQRDHILKELERGINQGKAIAKKHTTLEKKLEFLNGVKEMECLLLELRARYFIDEEHPEIRLNDDEFVGPIMAGV